MKSQRILLVIVQLVTIFGILFSPSPAHGRLGRLVISISAGDLNGDEKPDVAVGTAPGTIYAINTTGSILWSSQASLSYVKTVAIADFNRDGIGDILAGSLDSNTYVIAQNETLWVYTDPVSAVLSLAMGNLDGDEVVDVVVGSADNHCYAVAGATGDELWVHFVPSYAVLCVAAVDLDGDGLDDAVAASRDGVYAINGLTGATLWINWDPMHISSVVTIDDLNMDGIKDVIVSAYTNIYALSGKTGEIIWVQTAPHGLISAVVVGDFNGDQLNDIGAGTNKGYVYAFEGSKGNPLWINFESSSQVIAATVGDFNADGADDILVGSLDSCTYVISGSTGQLLWTNPYFLERVVQVAAADFNQDGVCDALAASGPNIYALDGLTGKLLWDTIGFWEYVGDQFIVPITSITVGLALLSLFILSWHRMRRIKEKGEKIPFWFGQGKLGAIFTVGMVVVSALVGAVQKDWVVADAATILWLSYLGTSFPTYLTGLTISMLIKPLAKHARLIKQVRVVLLLLFATHIGVFLYGLPTTPSS